MPKQSKAEKIVRSTRFALLTGAAVVAIIASMPMGRSQTAQESLLRKLTPAQAEMVRPLLQRGSPTPGGEIRGFVAASLWEGLALRDGALPHAQVFVQTAAGGIDSQSLTQTNSQGRFHIPPRTPGVYNVCASLSGFAKGCSLVPVVNQNVTLPEPITLKPLGAAIRGCVTLKDSTPAVRAAATSYESAGSAEVRAESGEGQVVAGPVPVNAAGCYVLPGLKATAGLSIVVRYEQAAKREAIPSGALERRNHAAVNVVLPTSPPTIASFTATLDGKEVSRARPGSTVAIEVKASSSNSYSLHYTWADSTGALLPGDQPSKQWKLPRTNSQNLIFVEVSDGHGGVARASLSVATGPASTTDQKLARRFNFNLITAGTGTTSSGVIHTEFTHIQFIDPGVVMEGICVDVTPPPSPLPLCKDLAKQYYQTIGVFDASNKATGLFTSFKAWKAGLGFSDDPTTPAAGETRAVYYNNGDLQFGRDMHCLGLGLADPAGPTAVGVFNVCYVANYSDGSLAAGGDPQTSIRNAENNTNPIAVVAMVGLNFPPNLTSPTWINDPSVEFIVFTPPTTGDPIDDFVPNTQALLDSEGAKAVPGVCIACHGGSYDPGSTIGLSRPSYDQVNNLVSGRGMARFLPFDTPSFLYDQQIGTSFSEASQSEQFRVLNTIARNVDTDGLAPGPVIHTITSQTTLDLISGWYSWCNNGVDTPGCSIDDVGHPFIPSVPCTSVDTPATCGWTSFGNLYNGFYQQVPRGRMPDMPRREFGSFQLAERIERFWEISASV
jgi:hypothetical protein